MRRMPIRVLLLALLGLSVAVGLPAQAGSIHLAWDPASGASGYRIYYGTASGTYTNSLDVGNSTSGTVTGLADCSNWYLAVKAYNSAGESPGFSNEVVGWARPTVGTPSPSAQQQGSQFTLDIFGSNFQSGATVEIDNPNVFLGPPAVVACDQIQVAVTVEPMAPNVRPAEIGRFTLTVVNPDQVFGDGPSSFEVLVNPARFDVVNVPGPSQGRLEGRDTILISTLFGSQEGGPVYDPDSDFNGDGWVDGLDLAYLAGNLGRCWSGSVWTVASCPQTFQ